MLKERRGAVEDVAEGLHQAEDGLEEAIARLADLGRRISIGRMSAKISAMFCQSAMERVGDAYTAALKARRELIEAHRELSTVQQQIGLGAVRMDGGVPKPPNEVTAGERRALRAVSSADGDAPLAARA